MFKPKRQTIYTKYFRITLIDRIKMRLYPLVGKSYFKDLSKV